MKNIYYYKYPIGEVGIAEENGTVSHVIFKDAGILADVALSETPPIKKAAAQLSDYFAGKRKSFDFPIILHGTAFQKSVWEALLTIPVGETRSYKELAIMIGKPSACRAVGAANGRNPIAVIIPCHRVIGSDGSLTGYAGGLSAKQYLLELEKKYV